MVDGPRRLMCGSPSRRAVLAATALPGLAASPSTSAAGRQATAAARAVLRRRLGPQTARIALTLSAAAEAEAPWYAYRCGGSEAHVEASSPVALVRGAYACLRDPGAWSASWEGDRVALPAVLPTLASGRVTTPFRRRAYLNTCTFGYTTPWWDWPRWEREIDWMALHGVDLPLALEGQEYVWQALWREEGLGAGEIAAHFSGPGFCPWQRMGNIEGHLAPLSTAWIGKKHALQVRILARMRALGMEPILPAFAGYVPEAFARAHPQANIHRMRPWEGFAPTFWLDPADPLFAHLARRFLELYTETYGAGRYYLADAFNETLPPVGQSAGAAGYGDAQAGAATAMAVDPALRDARLKAYGQTLCDSIRSVRPDAVWVMQGWLFGADRAFWTPDAIAAFLGGAPDDGMLVLDIGNDRYPEVWKAAGAFHGKPWIYGYVHNYGGSNPVYGDLDFYRTDLVAVASRTDTGRLAGFGVFPEGLHSNSIVYAYLFDRAWAADPSQDVAGWLRVHLRARYGHTSAALEAAWADLVQAAFHTRYWTPRWWQGQAGAYLLFKRPSLKAAEYDGDPGDLVALRRGVRALAALAPGFAGEPLFAHDLAEMTRHLASLEIDGLLPMAIKAYRTGDLREGDRLLAKITAVTLATDRIAGAANDGLAGWLDAARAYADTPADARAYAENAKMQITLWGGHGHLNDYASKAWQGLYRDFYLPRWTRFLQALRASGATFDQAAFTRDITGWEHDWVRRDTRYRHERPADLGNSANALLQRLDQP